MKNMETKFKDRWYNASAILLVGGNLKLLLYTSNTSNYQKNTSRNPEKIYK